MKNTTLRIALGLLAAAALMGCQKNADKQGVSVRGSRAVGANGSIASTGTVSSVTVDQVVSSLSPSASTQLLEAQLSSSSLYSGSIVGAKLGVRLCLPGLPAASAVQTGFTPTGAARIQVDLYDQWAMQGLPPLSTALTFLQGYTQSANGYTYIAAEFGDGYGTIAIDGYLDGNNLINGRVMENTTMTYNQTPTGSTSLQQLGTFSISEAELLGCN